MSTFIPVVFYVINLHPPPTPPGPDDGSVVCLAPLLHSLPLWPSPSEGDGQRGREGSQADLPKA
jgi:hypothetical protein